MKNLIEWSIWLGGALVIGSIIGKWPKLKLSWRQRRDTWFIGQPKTIHSYTGLLPPATTATVRPRRPTGPRVIRG